MISVVLLTRAIPSANALVRRLVRSGGLRLVIAEGFAKSEPKPPTERLRSFAYGAMEMALDRALHGIVLERTTERELRARKRVFGSDADPLRDPPPIEHIDHKAWDRAIPLIERERPDLICVFGTSLLPRAVAHLARLGTVNLHSGLAPHYRGVNCVAFGIINDDLENIGATLHLVTEAIDGGAIVSQARPEIEIDDDEVSLVYKVQEVSHRLCSDLIARLSAGAALRSVPQPANVGHLFLQRAFTPAHERLVRRLVAGGTVARYVERERSGRKRMLPIVTA
jgi:folate-dependent phosphoribosylglycinamide formyltransferase PurN